ncbi:GFA family protein [Labrys neptuniae]
MSVPPIRATGSCLCGGVRYEVRGALTPVGACHCSQCAKTSGNYLVSSDCDNDDLVLTAKETLRWYRSSERAERGFCSNCGGNLFWRAFGAGQTSITAGTIDPPTGLTVVRHIHVGSKSDYYLIADGVEQRERS